MSPVFTKATKGITCTIASMHGFCFMDSKMKIYNILYILNMSTDKTELKAVICNNTMY